METTKILKELTQEEQMSIFGGEVKYIPVVEYDKEGKPFLVFKRIEV